MEVAQYTKELRRWLKPLFAPKPLPVTTRRCCIHCSPQSISLLHFNKTQDAIESLYIETLPYSDLKELGSALQEIVKKHDLHLIPTYWLLSPENYQLFLIESLPVEPKEFHDALNWRIRSLINYPLEEAVVDYFTLPNKKGSSARGAMIGAVVANINQLKIITECFTASGLCLTTIDIPELAMRNLSALYEDDEKSTAFIYFYEDKAILNITKQKILYFTRSINLTLNTTTNQKNYELISLDILRYFDYYQSQWRNPSPHRIFIGTEKDNAETIAKSLSEHLLLTAEPYALKLSLANKDELHMLENKHLLMTGCALRDGKQNATTRN